VLLFENRSKNFGYLAHVLGSAQRLMVKSFLVLSFKKELLAVRPAPKPRQSGKRQGQGRLV
jgi:hypothetical protein